LTSASRDADTFPRNFKVRWIFSLSTDFKSPPSACNEDKIDDMRERTC
jgi:hypothetical protein